MQVKLLPCMSKDLLYTVQVPSVSFSFLLSFFFLLIVNSTSISQQDLTNIAAFDATVHYGDMHNLQPCDMGHK